MEAEEEEVVVAPTVNIQIWNKTMPPFCQIKGQDQKILFQRLAQTTANKS